MNWLSQQELEYLGKQGLAATEALGLHSLTSPPSVYLHRFSRDGILRWLWGEPLETVPAGVPPVTEPADEIAKTRRLYGWEVDRPVYGCDGGVLRLYRQDAEWLLDNALVYNLGSSPATFVWRFESLERAIDAATRYFVRVSNDEQSVDRSSQPTEPPE